MDKINMVHLIIYVISIKILNLVVFHYQYIVCTRKVFRKSFVKRLWLMSLQLLKDEIQNLTILLWVC